MNDPHVLLHMTLHFDKSGALHKVFMHAAPSYNRLIRNNDPQKMLLRMCDNYMEIDWFGVPPSTMSSYTVYGGDERRHNVNDEPAVIQKGTKLWYKNGIQHRDGDKPAIIGSDGSKMWCKHGKKHRDGDQPASILLDGTMFWYQNNVLHRDNDKPAIIGSDGSKFWYTNGKSYKYSVE